MIALVRNAGWLLLAAAAFAACGGTSAVFDGLDDAGTGGAGSGSGGGAASGDGGAGDASSHDASRGDAAPPTKDSSDAFACGATTCAATQYCVQPCCGGPAPQCEPMPASGVCPPGTHEDVCYPSPGSSGFGCRPDPCRPPPPFCVDGTNDSRANGCTLTPNTRTLACVCW